MLYLVIHNIHFHIVKSPQKHFINARTRRQNITIFFTKHPDIVEQSVKFRKKNITSL